MLLLSAAFDPARVRRRPALARPCVVAAGAAIVLGSIGLTMETIGAPAVGRGIAATGAHVGFLAVGWIVADGGRPASLGPLFRIGAFLLAACVASRITAWGALLYLIPPLCLFRESRRHAVLRDIGAGVIPGPKALALGFGAGTLLGLHLLISASLTFGYGIRVDEVGRYLAAVGYDIGANALTAEWLFRGALFSVFWRRWEFWPAAAVATALALGRYLLDPALPASLEVRAGAVFYMSLLGLSACALRAISGSLLPGYLATVAFFAAYRLLAQ
jgi:hypothetical protein